MEVAMETGTLKELNVKPGDVVECVDHGVSEDHLTFGKYYDIVNGPMLQTDMGSWWGDGVLAHTAFPMLAKFRILSRATPTPDLTAITTPFGLLDEAIKKAMRAHGGPYEMWDGEEWDEGIPSWYGDCTYRVKPSPISETIRVTITNDDQDGLFIAEATVITRNGKPDWSTLQVHND